MWSTADVLFAVIGTIAAIVLISYFAELFINYFNREDK